MVLHPSASLLLCNVLAQWRNSATWKETDKALDEAGDLLGSLSFNETRLLHAASLTNCNSDELKIQMFKTAQGCTLSFTIYMLAKPIYRLEQAVTAFSWITMSQDHQPAVLRRA
jgi:hypothetical protein